MIEDLENPSNLVQISFGDVEMENILANNTCQQKTQNEGLQVSPSLDKVTENVSSMSSFVELPNLSESINNFVQVSDPLPHILDPSEKSRNEINSTNTPSVQETCTIQEENAPSIKENLQPLPNLEKIEDLSGSGKGEESIVEDMSCENIIVKEVNELLVLKSKEEAQTKHQVDETVIENEDFELNVVDYPSELNPEIRSYLHVTKTNLKMVKIANTVKDRMKQEDRLEVQEREVENEEIKQGVNHMQEEIKEGKEEGLNEQKWDRDDEDCLELSAPDIARLNLEEEWVEVPVSR